MKKQLGIIFLLLLCVSIATASTPTIQKTIDLGGSGRAEARMAEIDSTHLLILDQNLAGQCKVRVVNTETGVVTDTATFSCTSIMDVDYQAGTIATCTSEFTGGSGYKHHVRVYKYPEEGYLQYKAQYASAFGAAAFYGGCAIDKSSTTSADVLVNNLYYGGSAKDGDIKVYLNGSSPVFTAYPITVPVLRDALYDTTAKVFGTSNDFYNNSDPYNNSILSSLVLGTNLVAWNHDSTSPEWVTDNGYLVIAGDYTSPSESSGSVTMDDVIAFASRSEIYGLIDGWWYVGDFTNAGTPTLDNLSVAMTNYDPSPNVRTQEYTTGSSLIYYMNETNDILTVWAYDSSPSCTTSDGCFLDEPFSYSTSLLAHGWGGSDVSPTNEQYICDGASSGYQENYIDIGRITDESFLLTVELAMCDGDSTEFYISMGDDDLTSFALLIDSNGVMTDHTGATIGSFPVTCDGYTNYTTLWVIGYPSSSPKSWAVYVNEELVKKNLQFTVEGNTQDLTWLYIGGNLIPDYCNYSIDSVSIYALSESVLSEQEIFEQSYTLGALYLEPANSSFDWSRCKVGENPNICFMREVGGGLLDWAWRNIVKNPLTWLVFVFLVILVVFMKGKR